MCGDLCVFYLTGDFAFAHNVFYIDKDKRQLVGVPYFVSQLITSLSSPAN